MKLTPDKHNANRGTKRGRELLEQSLRELGAGRSILVDKDGEVIAGNKTLEAAQKLGLKVRVVPAARDELVVVQREDLDLDEPSGEARRMAYLDNRVAELDLAWDAEQVAADIEAGLTPEAMGFWEDEARQLLVAAELEMERPDDPGVDMSRAEEYREKWGTETGQVWTLGRHRLLVGDCTDEAAMGRLMGEARATLCWTDPPYNVDYEGKTKARQKLANDQMSEADFEAFARGFAEAIWQWTVPGAALYLTMGTRSLGSVDRVLRERGFRFSSVIIWVKDSFVISRGDYHHQYEPMWYGWKGDARRARKVIDRQQSDVWMIDRPKHSELHPTMKPVELVERALANSTMRGDLVLDPFGGSGTTLIACERLGRVCYTAEVMPEYAAAILERWERMTGEAGRLEG